jgi:hypothetical protein
MIPSLCYFYFKLETVHVSNSTSLTYIRSQHQEAKTFDSNFSCEGRTEAMKIG